MLVWDVLHSVLHTIYSQCVMRGISIADRNISRIGSTLPNMGSLSALKLLMENVDQHDHMVRRPRTTAKMYSGEFQFMRI